MCGWTGRLRRGNACVDEEQKPRLSMINIIVLKVVLPLASIDFTPVLEKYKEYYWYIILLLISFHNSRYSVVPVITTSEKQVAWGMEKNNTPSQDDEGLPAPGSKERLLAERRLVRKLDVRLVPTIFLIFIMNYIDVS